MSSEDLDAGPDDLRLRRIADAALEVWTDFAPARALRAALPAALQLARLARVESWRRCLGTMTAEECAEFGSFLPTGWVPSSLIRRWDTSHGCDATGPSR